MAGRTVNKHTRAYVDGYDMSGYTVSVGGLSWGFDPGEIITLTDPVKGALPGKGNISIGNINGVFDNTATSGMHTLFSSSADAVRDVMIPIGDRAAPIAGVPTFCAQVNQNTYQAEVNDGILTATLGLGNWDMRADSIAYPYPWGWLLHAKSARTAANTSSGGYGFTAAASLGGYMMYHVFAGSTGTVTISVEDSTGGAWTAVDGLTSGAIAANTVASKVVATTAATTTIDKHVRWQLAFGTATTVTFALALVRGR